MHVIMELASRARRQTTERNGGTLRGLGLCLLGFKRRSAITRTYIVLAIYLGLNRTFHGGRDLQGINATRESIKRGRQKGSNSQNACVCFCWRRNTILQRFKSNRFSNMITTLCRNHPTQLCFIVAGRDVS